MAHRQRIAKIQEFHGPLAMVSFPEAPGIDPSAYNLPQLEDEQCAHLRVSSYSTPEIEKRVLQARDAIKAKKLEALKDREDTRYTHRKRIQEERVVKRKAKVRDEY